MTEREVLWERARRHGLHRRDNDVWVTADGVQILWAHYVTPIWTWQPNSGSLVPYPSEEAALGGLLQWLDAREPDRAWTPPLGGPLAGVARLLRAALANLEPASVFSAGVAAQRIRQALHALNGVALPSTDNEGAVLQVAVDYLLSRGALPEGTQQALVTLLRLAPATVRDAQIAFWGSSPEGVKGRFLYPLIEPETGWIAHIYQNGPQWHLLVSGQGPGELPPQATQRLAEEACARLLPDWVVLPSATREGSTCPTCSGVGAFRGWGGERTVCTACQGSRR